MGKSQRMKANPHKPGDFWYKEGDGEVPSQLGFIGCCPVGE
jgi:hypothetical protein